MNYFLENKVAGILRAAIEKLDLKWGLISDAQLVASKYLECHRKLQQVYHFAILANSLVNLGNLKIRANKYTNIDMLTFII